MNRKKSGRIGWIAAAVITTISAIILFLRANNDVTMVEGTRFLMGTIIQIKVPARSAEEKNRSEEAMAKAFAEMVRIENVFSVFKVDSEISRINRTAADGPVQTTAEALGLIEEAIEYNKKTAGVFDITVKPLVDLWRRAWISQKVPEDSEVKAALEKVGSRYIVIDKAKKTITFAKYGMGIDLGGIAKGYATDRAVKVLKENGIKNAIVNSGGDMYCLGTRSGSQQWRVGIQHPRDKDRIFFELKLKDMAIDSSGDYERYFMLNGKRYAHIIDPRTGYPIGDKIMGATVISKISATPLATALCILGEEGLKLIDSMEGVGALIFYNDNGMVKFKTSKGMKKYDITRI